jgi:hypothetical protein
VDLDVGTIATYVIDVIFWGVVLLLMLSVIINFLSKYNKLSTDIKLNAFNENTVIVRFDEVDYNNSMLFLIYEDTMNKFIGQANTREDAVKILIDKFKRKNVAMKVADDDYKILIKASENT